jgi:hypothetical protein
MSIVDCGAAVPSGTESGEYSSGPGTSGGRGSVSLEEIAGTRTSFLTFRSPVVYASGLGGENPFGFFGNARYNALFTSSNGSIRLFSLHDGARAVPGSTGVEASGSGGSLPECMGDQYPEGRVRAPELDGVTMAVIVTKTILVTECLEGRAFI